MDIQAAPARPAARPLVVDAAPPAVAAAAETPTSEWIELIESLRLDIERLKNGPARPPSDPPPLRAGAASRSKDKSKPAAKKRQPVQDEWGFFDPEQCGFAALLAKLDEITDATDEHAPPAH